MSERLDPRRELDLHAYVDGQIEPGRREEVEAWIASDPLAARLAAVYARQNAALHAIYDPVLREPVPPRLKRPPPRRWPRWLGQGAAAAALLLVGAAAGWWLGSQGTPPGGRTIAERAAVAYAVYAPEVRHPVEVAAAEQDHLAAWLSKRLGTSVRVPHLADAGFTLVGGRLLPDVTTPAAQFMYEDARGRRLTLYVRTGEPSNRETAFRWDRQGAVLVCYWIDGPVGYALAGEVARDEMQKVAEVAYRQLEQ